MNTAHVQTIINYSKLILLILVDILIRLHISVFIKSHENDSSLGIHNNKYAFKFYF